MDANRFDSISKFFAQRRLSRREAMIKGGTALAATGFAATGLAATGIARTANAQEATPAAVEDAGTGDAMLLFVQSFQAGSIAPKEGKEGRYTLTLESGVGQTIYFSDRPDRVVGATTTTDFIANLGFPDDNPPNAALVVENAAGETDVAVVELFSPVYDEATQGLTYEIAVLANWEADVDMTFHEAPTDLGAIEPSFGAAHLFIDSAAEGWLDCPDADLTCSTDPGTGQPRTSVGVIPNADHDGFCVARPALWCSVCKFPEAGGSWDDECNRRFPECNGQCRTWPRCTNC